MTPLFTNISPFISMFLFKNLPFLKNNKAGTALILNLRIKLIFSSISISINLINPLSLSFLRTGANNLQELHHLEHITIINIPS